MKKISKNVAQKLLVYYHNLDGNHKLHGKSGILEYIRKVGCIQFDPLNVVGYNSELVLQSRIVNFIKKDLHELLYKDRKLVDSWDKNMSIYSIEDWPFFKGYRERAYISLMDRLGEQSKYLADVKKELSNNGPITSSDLKYKNKINWSWAPTKLSRALLESMYHWGELIIYKKDGTRKTYDFAYKHIPKEIINSNLGSFSEQEYYDWHIARRIHSVGILTQNASDAWLGIHSLKSEQRKKIFSRLLEKNIIEEIKVEGIDKKSFIPKKSIDLLQKIINEKVESKHTAKILAPLDNLLWDRKLIKSLFNFEYKWEVYTPVKDRIFGYYVLPVLYDNKFIARVEPVMDKKENILLIKNWWWEDSVKKSNTMIKAIKDCLINFKNYQNAKDIKYIKEINL